MSSKRILGLYSRTPPDRAGSKRRCNRPAVLEELRRSDVVLYLGTTCELTADFNDEKVTYTLKVSSKSYSGTLVTW